MAVNIRRSFSIGLFIFAFAWATVLTVVYHNELLQYVTWWRMGVEPPFYTQALMVVLASCWTLTPWAGYVAWTRTSRGESWGRFPRLLLFWQLACIAVLTPFVDTIVMLVFDKLKQVTS